MSGKIVVKLDGEVVGDDRMLTRKKDVSFDVDGHPAVVTVHFAHAGFSAKSDLHVDDRYVEPLKR
jgi:hypothetical protein